MAKKKPKFVRKDTFKKSRLGKRRKKKQIWRKPKGRHSKVRRREAGYRRRPSIGYCNQVKERGLIKNKQPVKIYNSRDLDKVKATDIAIVARIGAKKKIEIAKKALEKNIKLLNLNSKKFLKKIEEKKKKPKPKKVEKKVEEKKTEEKKQEEKKEEEKKVEEKKEVKTEVKKTEVKEEKK